MKIVHPNDQLQGHNGAAEFFECPSAESGWVRIKRACRGIVVGVSFRRLVSRTIAQQLRTAVEEATEQFQYALTTRSGGQCVAHAVQALTEADPSNTILSVDGVGAFDLVSRGAMMSGLLRMEGGGVVLTFVRQLYGRPSS